MEEVVAKKKQMIQLIFVVLLISSTGISCDKITSFKESISGKSQTPAPADTQTPAPAKNSQNKDKSMSPNTLAMVGDWSITIEEFKDRLDALKDVLPDFDTQNSESQALVLEELVNQQLIVEGAERAGLTNSKDIEAAVEEFRRTLIVREAAKNLTEKIEVTEEEVAAFYEEKKDVLIEPLEWRVSEIVLETQEKANQLLIEILKGADFAQAARDNSISDSASKGGDLGILTEEPFPQMVNALLSLEEGDVSSVFKGPDGFYIVKLTQKKGGAQIPFEEIKQDIIANQTLLKQQKVILDHIETLKQQINVQVNKDLLR
jgi:peptidyl-prolyl cis-trans isomerase C